MRNIVIVVLAAMLWAVFVSACAETRLTQPSMNMTQSPSPGSAMKGMDGMTPLSAPTMPPVKGYSEGQEIRFIHTEASDPKIAKILTDMMGSPVLMVPSLARAPEAMVANVYVFENGVEGDGPLGFQPDVFDSPPNTEGYSPLRAVSLVTWKNEGPARELKSAAEVKESENKGEVVIERPGVVINMPMLTWPGGQR